MNTTAADDPLAQTFINAEIFTNSDGSPMDCYSVLLEVAKLFYATVRQWGGYWWFVKIAEMVGPFDYREFNLNGNYVTNGTYDPLLNVDQVGDNAVRFVSSGSNLTTEQAISKVKVTQSLTRARDSLIKGFFETRDAQFSGGIFQAFLGFDGWGFVFNGEDGNTAKIAKGDGTNWWKLEDFEG